MALSRSERRDLYSAGRCEACGSPKEHLEWLVCDDHFNLAHPPLKQPGIGPA